MNTVCRGGGGRAPVMLGIRVIVAWLVITVTMLAFSSNKGVNAPAREVAPLTMITCSWSGGQELLL